MEMGHGLAHRFDPLTVCSYSVDMEDIVDLSTEAGRAAEGVTLSDLACEWRYLRSRGEYPPSWAIAEALAEKGVAGILTPSFARSASTATTNLVLWKWGPSPPHFVEVYDPSQKLPKDQSSWPPI